MRAKLRNTVQHLCYRIQVNIILLSNYCVIIANETYDEGCVNCKADTVDLSDVDSLVKPRQSRAVFRSAAHDVVREWLDQHAYHPRPASEEKERIAERLGVSLKQIPTLINNERRRYDKHVSPNIPPSTQLNSLGHSPAISPVLGSQAINISFISPHSAEKASPIARYLSSSPEDDPQPVEITAKAASRTRSDSPVPWEH